MNEKPSATGIPQLRIFRLAFKHPPSYYQEKLGIFLLVMSLFIGGYLLISQTKTTQITYKENPPNPSTKISTKAVTPPASQAIPVEPKATAAKASSAPESKPAIVSINTGTLADLDSLPGIGPSTAQKIIDYRTSHGKFTALSQLQDVSGIGPAKYAKLQGLISL